MTNDDLRALADALSRQRQADEHGIYCAVPRQAVDAAIKHLRAQADAQPVAWMYEHDGCVDTPLFTVNRWTKCEEPWNESPLFLHPAPAAPQGDASRMIDALQSIRAHVEHDPSALAAAIVATCDSVLDAAPQAEPIDPHMIVADDRFPDEQAEPKREPLTYEQLVSACYTYRHDFGLLDPDEQHLVIEEAGRWAKAFGIGGSDAE